VLQQQESERGFQLWEAVEVLGLLIWAFLMMVAEYSLKNWETSNRLHAVTFQMIGPTTDIVKICKIWGFHGSDYEEWRLLGYKTPVRTSQETHYVSTTEFSPLMLCKIWGFHGSDYEEWRLLGCYTVWLL
jgi:hypothetical protein